MLNLKPMTLILSIIPIIAILALILQQSHLLITLLVLEALALSLVLLLPLALTSSLINLGVLRIILLSFRACEASLGLSLLIIMSRTSGSDLVLSLSMNKC